MPALDKLTRQFDPGSLPDLVARLAEGISKAQGALNEDYALNLAKFVRLVNSQDETSLKDLGSLVALFERVAPPRYQFTETTIELRVDLALSGQRDITVGLSGGAGGFSVQAGFASSTAYQYRGAASIRTVIHAIPSDSKVFETLLKRIETMKPITLPSTQPPGEGLGALKEVAGEIQAAEEEEEG